MIKYLLITVLSLLFLQDAKAQRQDTLLYYMKNSGELTPTKDSADYFLVIMPADENKLYPITELYPNGKNKLLGKSTTKTYSSLMFDGPCITYFPNGHRKSIANYEHGSMKGEVVRYYPNGKLYNTMNYNPDGTVWLIECRDSVGNVLAKNGNGKWIAYNFDKKQVIEEGSVRDSLQDGEWKETLDRGNYVLVYEKGVIVSSTDPYRPVGKQPFVTVEIEPKFINGGDAGFQHFLIRVVRYPAIDFEDKVQGKVVVSFIVEADGSLTNIKALSGPSKTLEDAAVKAVSESPKWEPGLQNGQPARMLHTASITFSIANN